jgi:Rrf2 family transcriptional regulator, iron-sulfur cluster assembly transcription factor
MMNLSKTVGYAVHALSCLEQAQGEPLFVQEIAESTGIMKPYLARVINRLVHQGLIASKRGYRGGIVLALPAEQISLARIVQALDGDSWSQECFFGLEKCPAARACPAHVMWSRMRKQIDGTLSRTTLADVTRATRLPGSRTQKEPGGGGARGAGAAGFEGGSAWREPWGIPATLAPRVRARTETVRPSRPGQS